jgi:hypothetical protein
MHYSHIFRAYHCERHHNNYAPLFRINHVFILELGSALQTRKKYKRIVPEY